ncbi:TrmH family RNA methyltransferase [Demequina pelophila]|uniref:TrmH family RNA methyltransferase n=1 Tax=Demequina pelophila TaxID=1638984 RepID=UPI0007851701|nr:TrmH family RNA methyltransferase [Demequina pelophila]
MSTPGDDARAGSGADAATDREADHAADREADQAVDREADQAPAHGAGPWPGEWPTEARYDPELLEHGDRRNVVDRYRYWRHEAIVADLDTRRHPFHVAIENWQHDLNIGSVVRTANAFLAAEVHIVGNRRWNRRGAMVTDRYQHVRHHPTVGDLADWARASALPVIGIDNLPGSVPLETFDLPRECVLVFGQESVGLSDAMREAAVATLAIGQYGSTRSINAGAAAAIAMHAWVRQHADVASGHLG